MLAVLSGITTNDDRHWIPTVWSAQELTSRQKQVRREFRQFRPLALDRVEFFKHFDWDRQIVVLELEDRLRIMQQRRKRAPVSTYSLPAGNLCITRAHCGNLPTFVAIWQKK